MKKISTEKTYLYRVIIPMIGLIFCLSGMIDKILSGASLKDIVPFFIPVIVFALVWAFYCKDLKEVFVDSEGFIINGKKVLFENIQSVKNGPTRTFYSVKYYEGEKIMKFRFAVEQYSFLKPGPMKEIIKLIEQKKV